jgi:LCP family protein required for cell wall assembly
MNQNTNRSMAHPRKSKPSIDRTGRILLAAFAVIGIILAIAGGKFVYDLVKGWSLTSLPGAPVTSSNAPTNNSTITPGTSLQTANAPAAASWDGKSRINILLLGLDYTEKRATTEGGPSMSDTMILVTVDPMTKTLGALSIRRDLWVNVPGHDYNKINKAYWWGEVDNIPGVGGPGLAMRTVEEFLGVPINFYARVDFNTFVKLVDEIGGVPIDVKERMLIDPNHTGSPFWMEPGFVVMPGNYALEYARSRSSSGGDIDRGGRQMEVVNAIWQKIVSKNMMPQLISRAPALYQELSSGVQTNMTLGQAIQLGLLFVQIPQSNFKTYNITYDHASPEMIWADGSEQYVLRPFMDRIRLLRDEIFVQGSTAAAPITISTQTGQDVSGDPLSLAKAENARVVVLNGTNSAGLADVTTAYLTTQGLNVVSTGNSSENYTYTTIVVHNATPYTLAYLSSIMGGIPTNRIYNRYEPEGNVDITVYLGSDWANSNPMP